MATMNVSLDIEDILTRSIMDFGVKQTETYYESLTHCLELLGDNSEMGSAVDDIRTGYRCFFARKPCHFLHSPSTRLSNCPYSA